MMSRVGAVPDMSIPLLAAEDTSATEVLLWSAAMLVLLAVGMAFAVRLKRRMKQVDDAPASMAGFTLSDLRQMHRAGQLTDEEFDRAKGKIVAAAQKAAERIPPQTDPARDSTDAIRARRVAREQQPRGGSGGDEPDDP
jgi:hypothetical protein